MIDRKTIIEYMKKAVACDNEDITACFDKNCRDCPHDYPMDDIELIESALKLLEAEENHETD